MLQIRSQKVFVDEKPSPNTVSEGVWSCKEYTLKKIHHLVRWFFQRFPALFDFPWNIPLWSTYTTIIPLDVRIKTSIYRRFSHCHDYCDWFAAYKLSYNTSYNLWKIASSIQVTNQWTYSKPPFLVRGFSHFQRIEGLPYLGLLAHLVNGSKKIYGLSNIHCYNYMDTSGLIIP